MAPPRPSQKRPTAAQPPRYRAHPPRPPAGPPEVVDPVWLLKAVGILIVASLFCGYATLCLLLYQGQWQLILHPKQTNSHPAAIAGTPVEFVRFGPDESATPQRTGWHVPAAAGARYAEVTILFLPAGDGSLADAVPTLTLLHELGVSVFAMDYRGYGQSAALHPNQERMTEDARSAWKYLTASRGVPESHILPYGVGLGASLATELAASHPGIPGVILDSPAADPLTTVRNDPRTSSLPVNLLLHDRFPLAEPLSTLKTPKLLLAPDSNTPVFAGAAMPKVSVVLPVPRSASLYTQSLARFFDSYRIAAIPTLAPPQR